MIQTALKLLFIPKNYRKSFAPKALSVIHLAYSLLTAPLQFNAFFKNILEMVSEMSYFCKKTLKSLSAGYYVSRPQLA